MSGTCNKFTALGFASAFGFLAAAGPLSAQDNPCPGNVEHRLQEYGLTMSDLENVEWIAQRFSRDQSGQAVSYHMWSTPKSCDSGTLVVDVSSGCYVTNVYTQGGCSIKGIASY